MSLSLDGVRVVELTTMITGSLAGMMLADLGADVVKVERPDGGDPFRTFRGESVSPYFLAYNRNKRSIALDLTQEGSRAVLEALLGEADVLIENFRPGVLDRLGFDAARLANEWPSLIVCSISGFGPDGPKSAEPAYDAVAQAVSGLSSLFLTDPPRLSGPTIPDNLTGIFACYGVLAALYERERTGLARRVDTNMLDSALYFTPDTFLQYTLLGIPPGPLMRVQASQSFAITCSDERVVAIHMSSQEKFWVATCGALDREEWREDPRFDTRARRIENYPALADEFSRAGLGMTSESLCALLLERDVPHSLVKSLPEVIEDPQVKHLGSFVEQEHPEAGRYLAVRRPVYFDGVRDDQPFGVAPELNQDGSEIVHHLGIDAALRDRWLSEINLFKGSE